MRNVLIALTAFLLFVSTASAAEVDGLKLHSTTTGNGSRTIVFVHGWTCDETSWAAQVAEFAKSHRVITVDLPGHGKSDGPKDGKFSLTLFARAVEAVRAENRADRIVLVGHSMGAPVIREYARLYPQHVVALVAVDGPLDMRGFGEAREGRGAFAPPPMTGPQGLKNREQMINGMFTPRTPEPVQKHVMAMMMHAPEATAAGAMAAMFDPSISRTSVIDVPAYAIYAGTNTIPDVATVRQVLPKFEATRVEGTGHFVMMEKPAEFNALLTAYLQKVNF
ncbi:MAG TPA: alpha/beta hydrolase [Vicinamibacterales bacterium]|nr:alpha/beta hydrolase [Vicinamibacterales bacterium]